MSPDPSTETEARSLGEHAAEILPDLDLLAGQLQDDTGEAFPKLPEAESTPDLERERQELLAFARHAVEALRQCRGMEIRLMPGEEIGLRALLAFTSRPALAVQGGRFAAPPAGWEDLGTVHRAEIERALRSVGLFGTGTAWVVAPGLVMTSRSVAEQAAGGGARVDFGRELGAPPDESRAFEVPAGADVRFHPVHDLALVPVAGPLPPPLPLATKGVGEGRKVCVVGHPVPDPSVPERLLRDRLFQGFFGVKRVQPGQVLQVLPGPTAFLHDGSVLGGNPGAPVIDLETGRVVGVQSSRSSHGPASRAAALWELEVPW